MMGVGVKADAVSAVHCRTVIVESLHSLLLFNPDLINENASNNYFGYPGGGSEVAARALSLPDLNQLQISTIPAGLENEERSTMEKEISQIDRMIDDMEMKVNVLRWMVEPHGPQYAETLSSTDSASLALLSVDEEQPGQRHLCQRSHIFVFLLLFAVVLLAATLSVCIVLFS